MSRRGTTLAECVVALFAGAVILGALHALLLAAGRARARESAIREARSTVRAAASILRSELQGVSAFAGDILAVADTAITVRVVRAQAPVCTQSAPDRLALDASHGSWLRTPDAARDGVRIFLDDDPDDTADDGWWVGMLTGVGGGICPGGSAAVTLALAQPLPSAAVRGAPVRVFETVEYRLYRDASGQWMLGTRTRSSSGWTATSPLVGPLRPSDGLHIVPIGISGTRAATVAEAVILDVGLRSRSARVVPRAGGSMIPTEDSVRLAVAVGP